MSRTADTDWLAPRRPWTRRSTAEATGVGLVVCLLVVVLRTEIMPSDPWSYVRSARLFPDDSWVVLGYTRYGMILPLLPLTAVFGDSAIVYYFWPVVGSGALAMGLYLVAYRYWGRTFGLLSVLLGLGSPIVLITMSRGYPDILSTAIVTIAVVVTLAVRDRLIVGHRAPWWLWLTIGLLLGWGFETRETTILLWPLLAVVLWRRSHGWRGLGRGPAYAAAGIAAWAVTDMAIGALAYGDPLLRVHAFLRQDLSEAASPGDQEAREQLVGRSRLYYLAAVPTILAREPDGGWALLLGAFGMLGLAFRGGARFVTTWLLLSHLTFVGVTGFFVPDHPAGRIDVTRYWIAFLPLVGLAAAGALAEVVALACRRLPQRAADLRWRSARGVVTAVAVMVLAAAPFASVVSHAAGEPQLAVNGANQLAQLRSRLAVGDLTVADQRILTDFATSRLLPIYKRGDFGGPDLWKAQVLNIASPHVEPRTGDLVAINSLESASCGVCRRLIADWYARSGPIPAGWVEVWASSNRNLVLYRVA